MQTLRLQAMQTRSKRKLDSAKEPASSKKQATPKKKRAKITINRAPVLTLWASVVAQRERRLSRPESLTVGRYISGILAQSKGRSLSIYEAKERTAAEREAKLNRDRDLGVEYIHVMGIKVPMVKSSSDTRNNNSNSLRAISNGKPLDPATTDTYLIRSFGEADLTRAEAAMKKLANSMSVEELGSKGYHLYEAFRPEWKGWGVKGSLDLDVVERLAAGGWREH